MQELLQHISHYPLQHFLLWFLHMHGAFLRRFIHFLVSLRDIGFCRILNNHRCHFEKLHLIFLCAMLSYVLSRLSLVPIHWVKRDAHSSLFFFNIGCFQEHFHINTGTQSLITYSIIYHLCRLATSIQILFEHSSLPSSS